MENKIEIKTELSEMQDEDLWFVICNLIDEYEKRTNKCFMNEYKMY